MKRGSVLRHEFVKAIPERLQDGTVYVSIDFATVVHKCCCGCGHEVVTPLSPTDWRLIFDGETISLDPSVGNWNLPCHSHYFIRGNRVQWSRPWTRDEIAAEKSSNAVAKARYYSNASIEDDVLPRPSSTPVGTETAANIGGQAEPVMKAHLWRRLLGWIIGR